MLNKYRRIKGSCKFDPLKKGFLLIKHPKLLIKVSVFYEKRVKVLQVKASEHFSI